MTTVTIDSEELEHLKEDTERYRWVRDNYEWCRSARTTSADLNDFDDSNIIDTLDEHAYLKCRFPLKTNLSCAAMVDHAIDKEIKGKYHDR